MPPRRHPPSRARACALGALTAFALLVGGPVVADGAPSSRDGFDTYVAEAARRFDIPAAWIRAVIAAESGGDRQAVSRAGAQGLMQIMPETWADLRARLPLGNDPFDPRDNIIAGTAYLRQLLDRYGLNGFLAAYQAGPTRYEAFLNSGVPLPAETRAYVAELQPLTGGKLPDPEAWRASSLFASNAQNPAAETASNALFVRPSARNPAAESPP